MNSERYCPYVEILACSNRDVDRFLAAGGQRVEARSDVDKFERSLRIRQCSSPAFELWRKPLEEFHGHTLYRRSRIVENSTTNVTRAAEGHIPEFDLHARWFRSVDGIQSDGRADEAPSRHGGKTEMGVAPEDSKLEST